jgi:hypothetical protein
LPGRAVLGYTLRTTCSLWRNTQNLPYVDLSDFS